MSSFTQLHYHVVFGTKYRKRTLSHIIRERMFEYIGGIVRGNKGHLLEINGVDDHIHLLARLSPTLAVADVIRDIKANSSRWLNENLTPVATFEWQKGYGAFTVSHSQVDLVRRYIQNQPEHHRRKTFQEEYLELLQRHGIAYELKYVFEDEHHG